MSAKKTTDGNALMTKELLVTNKLGVHARPAAMFVKVANRFTCNIMVEKDGETINGKSIMGLMMLAAGPGTKLLVSCDGEDSHAALDAIEELVKRKFDEG